MLFPFYLFSETNKPYWLRLKRAHAHTKIIHGYVNFKQYGIYVDFFLFFNCDCGNVNANKNVNDGNM